jgi:DNA-binding LacI/PurR family transcriptional regulator
LTLKEAIDEGRLAPGSFLPSERALGAEYGMDRAAIRHALHLLEQNGLVVREPGRRPYVRYSQAPERKDGATAAIQNKTILVIVPQHPYYPASVALLHGITASLRSNEAPYRVQVFDTLGGTLDHDAELENMALDSAESGEVAGIILWHMGNADTVAKIGILQQQGVPIVLVDRFPPELPCDFVGVDNTAGIDEAINHLRSLGHTKIGHLTSDEPTTAVIERLNAYRESMIEANRIPQPDWIYVVNWADPTNAKGVVDQFLSSSDRPTGICAMNDALAHYFIAEIEARGLKVPDDVSVIGFDDLERFSPRPALLTTMNQPFDKIGKRAANLLIDRLKQPNAAPSQYRHILLPAPLVTRATCKAVGVEN